MSHGLKTQNHTYKPYPRHTGAPSDRHGFCGLELSTLKTRRSPRAVAKSPIPKELLVAQLLSGFSTITALEEALPVPWTRSLMNLWLRTRSLTHSLHSLSLSLCTFSSTLEKCYGVLTPDLNTALLHPFAVPIVCMLHDHQMTSPTFLRANQPRMERQATLFARRAARRAVGNGGGTRPQTCHCCPLRLENGHMNLIELGGRDKTASEFFWFGLPRGLCPY